MSQVHSFEPICAGAPRILILGSMPGKASLLAQQYYAHPRNAFWPIVGELFGIEPALPYPERCARLVAKRVAVWDVLKTCSRSGSLDSAIDADSMVPNDFSALFARHRSIRQIFFNGAMAEKAYLRHVLPCLPAAQAAIPRTRLPSTSPANASYSFARKVACWRAITEGPAR